MLRTQKLGESDRIITLLTRDRGRIRAVARGVRRPGSRLGARVEPFMLVDIQLYERRTLDLITQVETISPYARGIVADYGRYTAGTAMLETAERLTQAEEEPSLQLFLLLVGALRSLAAGEYPSGLVLDAFLLRSLSVSGWAPSFTDCARCGEPGPHRAFSLASGGSVCPGCRPPGSAAPGPQTLVLLGALLSGDWPTALTCDQRARREGSGLTAAYLQWHVERQLRSLRLVDREDRTSPQETGQGMPV
ncbi:MAG: repair protein RecO [Actinomycetota bacterium]|nr:repair protein RecO [Actinomycetota bacterium]